MTTPDPVLAIRAELVSATRRDLRRGERLRRRAATAAAGIAVLAAGTGVAAATGVLFAPPQIDHSVPVVEEWTYYTHNPFGDARSGPVLMRHRPAALARENRANEAELAAHGVTARCGIDSGHPLACFLPSGAPVAAEDLGPVLERDATAGDYDIRALTPAAAHAWLCDHPSQRPGADGGERPAPTAGYGDC
jgi:hypothetical protein